MQCKKCKGQGSVQIEGVLLRCPRCGGRGYAIEVVETPLFSYQDSRTAQTLVQPSRPRTGQYRGVTYNNGKWQVRIGIGKRGSYKEFYLGRYDDPQKAREIYLRAQELKHAGVPITREAVMI